MKLDNLNKSVIIDVNINSGYNNYDNLLIRFNKGLLFINEENY